MAQNQPIRRTAQGSEIPDKLYFRIGDVAKLCAVPAYVLRFWETEFPQLKPNKGGTGQRLYRKRDVELALKIKRLLYDEGYTIPGARQVFLSEQRGAAPVMALVSETPGTSGRAEPRTLDQMRAMEKLRKDMQDLHALLSRPAAVAASAPVQTIRAPRAARAQALSIASVPARGGMDNLFDFAAADLISPAGRGRD